MKLALLDLNIKRQRVDNITDEARYQSVCLFLKNFAQIDAVTAWINQHTEWKNVPPRGVANADVVIPAGRTGLSPAETAFFAALNVATKIVRATIEIINPVTITKKGERIMQSHATLIRKLGLRPFRYTIKPTEVISRKVVTNCKELLETRMSLLKGLRHMQAFSVEAGLYNPLSGPYYAARGIAQLREVTRAIDERLLGPQELPPPPPPKPVPSRYHWDVQDAYMLDILYGGN